MLSRVPCLLLACSLIPGFAHADEPSSKIALPKAERHWLGGHFWGNRLQDWQTRNGTLECTRAASRLPMRTAYLLTHAIAKVPADQRAHPFSISARITLSSGNRVSPASAGGFLIGIGGRGKMDYRAQAIVQGWTGKGGGFFCGVNAAGVPFILDFEQRGALAKISKQNQPMPPAVKSVRLKIAASFLGRGLYSVTATATTADGKPLGTAKELINQNRLEGGIALVSHPGKGQPRVLGKWSFGDLELGGRRIGARKSRSLGPILSTQYTLSRGVMKMTAQLLPVAKTDSQTVSLYLLKAGKRGSPIAKAKLTVPGYTATFRVPKWDDSADAAYEVVYELDGIEHSWGGVIRRDPKKKETIVVAGFTGNHNNAHYIGSPRSNWVEGMYFPHADIVRSVKYHKPDLLFFSGDQVYEGRSPTFPDRANIKLDYLYKWYMWCWAYRDITKNTPSIVMPDDHDVYQGNIWGQGGRKSPGRDHHGGYVHPADFVKMVERTQTSHLPDPFDPTPVGQGIGVYYSHLVFGRISIAILEDRKFKSGCARDDMPPSGTGRPDHFNDPKFDIKKLDIKGVELLGKRQEKFLRNWSADWKGADMKMAVSQTIFANMATHHGGNLMRLIADLDSNGWPQAGRNRALEELRRGFAFHLGGDQHLATIVHHGIKDHGDAIWSFCVPSVANFYPRAWAPECDTPYKIPADKEFQGKRRDGFGHPVTVYAATNPGRDMGKHPKVLHNGMPGYGIVKLNKKTRTIRMECWPRFADPAKDKPYAGWPKTINQRDNYRRKIFGYLPAFEVTGAGESQNPVVQVINEKTGIPVYTLRIKGTRFRPFVFEDGSYAVKAWVDDPKKLITPRVKSTGLKPTRAR